MLCRGGSRTHQSQLIEAIELLSMPESKKRKAVVVVSDAGKRKRKESRVFRAMRASVMAEEKKYLDTSMSVASVTSTGSVIACSSIQQGDDYYQRTGRKVRMVGLQYNFQIYQDTALVTADRNYNLYIVLDRQPNGVAPTVGAILDVTGAAQASFALKNRYQYDQRFKMLRHHFGIPAGRTSENASVTGWIDLSKAHLSDSITQWAGTTGTDPTTNGIYIVVASNNATASAVVLGGVMRVLFTDA